MDESKPFIKESSNYRPGEPLRPWNAEDPAPVDLEFAIREAEAGESLIRLLNGDEISKDDLIAFGRLNSVCVMRWYEPLVLLHSWKAPAVAPEHAALIRHTRIIRGR